MTAFAGVLDLDDRRARLLQRRPRESVAASARPARPSRASRQGGGPPLCTIDDFAYRGREPRACAPGEMLCLVTDGVTEAQNRGGRALRDRAAARRCCARLDADRATAREVVDAVCADLAAFVGDAERSDDLTLLVLRWIGPRAAAG